MERNPLRYYGDNQLPKYPPLQRLLELTVGLVWLYGFMAQVNLPIHTDHSFQLASHSVSQKFFCL